MPELFVMLVKEDMGVDSSQARQILEDSPIDYSHCPEQN